MTPNQEKLANQDKLFRQKKLSSQKKLSNLEKISLILSIPGLGIGRYWALLKTLGTIERIYSSPKSQLRQVLKPALVEDLCQIRQASHHPVLDKLSATLEWCLQNNTRIISHLDVEYPDLLRQIVMAPPYLFVKGAVEILSQPQIAIVGSRSSSRNGMSSAHRIASELGERGFVITSGLALGIDSQAHCGALDQQSQTIAVMGTGIDKVYPYRNRALAERIIDNGGAIVSEFHLQTPAERQNFPRRNRVISGLSLGTLVVEAAIKSGSLITAKYALEQNREVFAMPGSVQSPQSRGCHALIKQGAVLVESADDICAELSGFVSHPIKAFSEDGSDNRKDQSSLSEQEALILAKIECEPVSVDTLAALTGIAVADLLANLMGLEIAGYITNDSGGYSLC